MAISVTEPSNSKKLLSSKNRAILAITTFVIGTTVFIFAYLGMKQQIGLGKLNYPILTWMISHRSYETTNIAKFITSIANPNVFAIIVCIIVIAWMITKREIWRPVLLASSVAVAAATSTLLKQHFMDARPPKFDMIPTFEYDYSFPSGHTIVIAVFLLVIGYLIYSRNFGLKRFCIWMAAAIVGTALIAISRLYLGYHWLTDITASIGLALIILTIVIAVDTIFVNQPDS